MNLNCRFVTNSKSQFDCKTNHFEYRYRELWCDSCKDHYELSTSGYLPEESKEIEHNAVAGFAQDPERSLFALKVSTSEALIKRALPFKIGNERRY